MKNEIKVSIIIPVYNTEQYLRQCLDSVINQTFKNIEVIIINDGSTDGSLNILNEYKKNYSYIKVINQTNKGYSEVRNVGLKIASGDYIGFVDSDDFIEKNMFEQLVNKAIDTNADIVSCNYYMLYKKGEKEIPIASNNTPQINMLYKSDFCLEGAEGLLLDDPFIWNKIYKRKVLVNNNIEFSVDTSIMEDILFHTKGLLYSNKIVYISDILYFYRMKRNGAQTTLKDKRNFSAFTVCDELFELINSNKLLRILPWINILIIRVLCYGYERIEKKYSKEYFEKFYEYLKKYNINKKTKVLFPKSIFSNKTFLSYLRYLLINFLYAITIKCLLNKNKFIFDLVIRIRVLLEKKLSFYYKSFFSYKNKKSIGFGDKIYKF